MRGIVCPVMINFKFCQCEAKLCNHYLLLIFQVYFGMLDALLAAEELPEEYRDRCQVYVLLT